MQYKIGQKVIVRDEPGVIRFIGTTKFAPGIWFGIELTNPNGKHNGSVQGISYFTCSKTDGLYGVFVKERLLQLASTPASSSPLSLIETESFSSSSNIDRRYNMDNVLTSPSSNQRYDDSMDYDKLQATIEMHRKDNEYLWGFKLQLETKLEQLQKEYSTLKDKHAAALEEIEINQELEKELDNIDVENYTAQDLKILISRSKAVEASLHQYKDNERQKDIEIDTLLKKLNETNAKLAQSEAQLFSKECDIAALKEKIEFLADLESMTEQLSLENNNLKRSQTELRETIKEMNEIRNLDKNLEAHYDAVEEQLKLEISQLKDELFAERSKYENLKKTIEQRVADGAGSHQYSVAPRVHIYSSTGSGKEFEFEFGDGNGDENIRKDKIFFQQELHECELKLANLQLRLLLTQELYKLCNEKFRVASRLAQPGLKREYLDLLYALKENAVVIDSILQLEVLAANQQYDTFLVTILKHIITFAITLLEYNYKSSKCSDLSTEISSLHNYIEPCVSALLNYIIDNNTGQLLHNDLYKSTLDRLIECAAIICNMVSKVDDLILHTTVQVRLIASSVSATCNYLACTNLWQQNSSNKGSFDIFKKLQLFHQSLTQNFSLVMKEDIDIYLNDFQTNSCAIINSILVLVSMAHTGTASLDDNDTCLKIGTFIEQFPTLYETTSRKVEHISTLTQDDLSNSTYSITNTSKLLEEKLLQQEQEINARGEAIETKQQEIRDLQLNISLLEKNMRAMTNKFSKDISTFRDQLSLAQNKVQQNQEEISQLQTENYTLKTNLNAVEDGMLLQPTSLSTLESQIAYHDKIKRLETLIDLKQKAKQETVIATPLTFQSRKISSKRSRNRAVEIKVLANQIRTLANHVEPMQISLLHRNGGNNSRSRSAAYSSTCFEEQYAKYNAAKRNLIRRYQSTQ